MPILIERLNNLYLRGLRKIELNAFRLLWYEDYWDGPINGILLFQNNKYWFELFDESDGVGNTLYVNPKFWFTTDGGAVTDDSGYYRRFAIIELTGDQLSEEEYWHALYREKVGGSDYDENGKKLLGILKPKEMWPEFYEPNKSRKLRDLSSNNVIGWFEI